MALVSVQRVEKVCKNLITCLILVDEEINAVSSKEFVKKSPNLDKLAKYTLGNLFRLLNLNQNIGLENEFAEYLKMRNLFIHNFNSEYLNEYSEEQKKKAIDFCYEIGKYSEKMESYFKGLTYLLALTYIKDKSKIDPIFKKWETDYNLYIKERNVVDN